MKNILIINGPNLNLLGKREPLLYGKRSFAEYFADLQASFPEIKLAHSLHNSEDALIEALHAALETKCDGVVLNPAAFSHTSIAVADAVAALGGAGVKVVEVHISNIFGREEFRKHSFVSKYAAGVISGLGLEGYRLAVSFLAEAGSIKPNPTPR